MGYAPISYYLFECKNAAILILFNSTAMRVLVQSCGALGGAIRRSGVRILARPACDKVCFYTSSDGGLLVTATLEFPKALYLVITVVFRAEDNQLYFQLPCFPGVQYKLRDVALFENGSNMK